MTGRIKLDLPQNSRFNTSLNEIDLVFGLILQHVMRIADPRDKLGKPNSVGSDGNWLWSDDHIFQVDDLTTEDIFDTWLLRNKRKGVDVQYPLLAYKQEDIDTVFWGTGNRYRQWHLQTPVATNTWEVGDTVGIKDTKYKGYAGQIVEILPTNQCILSINNSILMDANKTPIKFYFEQLTPMGDKAPLEYKAKAMTGTYVSVILVDNRDEAQYLRNNFILRCADANIWWPYNSHVLNGAENQMYTVFEIPNIERYPSSDDKLQNHGYIYGIAFRTNVWATLTDTPLPASVIEMIRMNIRADTQDRWDRIIIN